MPFDWYPLNPVHFKRDTYHLCAAAEGIYRRLIDEYMTTGFPLPETDAALAGIARVSMSEWSEHAEVVRAFFRSKNGKLHQKRCDAELHARSMLAAERSRKAREAAAVRWAKDKLLQHTECDEHAHSNANAMLNDATLHKKDITLSSEPSSARASTEAVDNHESEPTEPHQVGEKKTLKCSPYLDNIMRAKHLA